jgi:hypothetical protein
MERETRFAHHRGTQSAATQHQISGDHCAKFREVLVIIIQRSVIVRYAAHAIGALNSVSHLQARKNRRCAMLLRLVGNTADPKFSIQVQPLGGGERIRDVHTALWCVNQKKNPRVLAFQRGKKPV